MENKIIIPTQNVENTISNNVAGTVASVGDSGNIDALITAHDMSLYGLFMQADIVVKLVMIMLIVASVMCWTIIFQKLSLISKTRKRIDDFVNYFWQERGKRSVMEIYEEQKHNKANPLARIFISGMYECYEKKGRRSPLNRAERALLNSSQRELSVLEKNTGFLATVGSSAPFIGLFGTVWGIMNSFQSIAMTNNTSLAVVAPGIAEALFATAIGLFAAIPAVIFYNKFSMEINKISEQVHDFTDEIIIYIEREFEDKV